MSMLLQHGHIHAPQTVIIIKIFHDAICAQLALGTKLSIDKPLAVPLTDFFFLAILSNHLVTRVTTSESDSCLLDLSLIHI